MNFEIIDYWTPFKLIALVNITPYLANSAKDESDLIRNIQFNSNLCIINMHFLFGITFILKKPASIGDHAMSSTSARPVSVYTGHLWLYLYTDRERTIFVNYLVNDHMFSYNV